MVRFLRLDPHPGEHLCQPSQHKKHTTANPASAIARAQQQYVVA
jgi:hypothetical protein